MLRNSEMKLFVSVIVFLLSFTCSNSLRPAVQMEPINKTCGINEFACDDGACVDDIHACDGVSHCADGSDERNCGTHLYKHKSPQTIRRFKRASEQNNVVTDCGVPLTPEAMRRVGVGWQAAIYFKLYNRYKYICGGSIVSSTVIISAASCFWDEAFKRPHLASKFFAAVGKRYRDWNSTQDDQVQKFDVKELIMAPRFYGLTNSYANDIALVVTKTSIQYTEFIKPVCLYHNTDELQLQRGVLGKIAGWGVSPVNNSPSDELQTIDFPYIERSECLDRVPSDYSYLITRDKMCAGFENGTRICRGDGGAGLAFLDNYRGRQRYYLRGVFSVALTMEYECLWVPIMGYTQISSHKDLIAKNVVLEYRMAINKDCGIPPSDRNNQNDGLPWHVAVYERIDSKYQQTCGGSLVDSNVVVSAAHCFWDKDEIMLKAASNYAVAAGKRYRDWNHPDDGAAQTSMVFDIKVGSRYDGDENKIIDNIALVFLKTAINFNEFVRPVCVNFDQDLDRIQIARGQIGKISGFGVVPVNNDVSPTVNTIDLPVMGIDECFRKAPYPYKSYLNTDKLCAGYNNGTKLCDVDSGAGLSFLDTYRGRQRYYLRGVLSFAPAPNGICGNVPVTGYTWLLFHEQFIAGSVVETPRVEISDVKRSTECGELPLNFDPLSIGGRPANRSEVPWHTGIYMKQKDKNHTLVHVQICGGTLISKSLVLSAAHCFASDEGLRKKPRRFAVAVGKLYREWDDNRELPQYVQKSNVTDIIMPENFYGAVTRFQADIAIVKVATEFQLGPHIVPVCLDFDYEFDNRQLRGGSFGLVAGWGYMNEEGVSSPVLKVVEEPIYNSSSCFHTVPTTSRELITTDKVCGGYVDGSQALCKGDSGGGLVIPSVENGVVRYYLRGIVSTATVSIKHCNRFSLTYFTRVRAHQYLISEWLTSHRHV